MNKKCLGCGAFLQFDKPELEGYVESNMYDKSKICRRCFRIKCYGDYVFINKSNEDYINILKDINNTDDLVLYVVDLFNINESIKNINEYIKNPLILVLSKKDLLPKSVKQDKIIKWLKQYNLDFIEVISISANRNYQLDKLYQLIKKHKRTNNVYVVGNTNAGKSTLINKLIKNYSNNESYITTSILPSTTLNMMEIKLNDDITLIDTPGLLDEGNIVNVVEFMLLKKIIPKKEIKPRTYQIKPNQSLLIDDIARVDYLEGEKNSFTIYIANEVEIERINLETNDKLRRLKEHYFDVDGNEDIVINGLCWIKIVNKAKVRIYTMDKIDVYKRSKLI